MRLIDADKFKQLFSPALTGKTTYTADEIMLSIVSSPTVEPTVEAIPVEWFKNLIKTVEDSKNYEESEILKWALNKWEKENEDVQ